MSVKWIRIGTQMFEDEKIRLIESMPESDTILIVWVKLLVQAGKSNASGYIYLSENIPFTEEMLATIFNRPLNTIRLALRTLEQFGMLTINENEVISITNWEKHQNVDGLDKIRIQTKERVAKHREKQKLLTCNVTGNATVTDGNATDIEEELDIDKEKEKDIGPSDDRPKRSKFIPPTLEEVTAYCQERQKGIDPHKWHDYYTSNGWMVGKTKMKDWKAAVRTWERNGYEKGVAKGGSTGGNTQIFNAGVDFGF